ncbi:MAG TPA: glycosyltransferase family 9 protein [Thermoanaerobaculia bacterium]|nr:glycosyltransferase family 9 protein [Thermoanaerobaculia bacterium]
MTKLLVVRLSALGDVIHAVPAVVALRERYDEIAWAVETPYRELVEIVAGVRAIPVSLKKWSVANLRAAKNGVRGFDVAIDFQGLIKSALLARASGAKERIGFASEYIKEKPASWFLTRKVAIDPSAHVVDWNLQLAGVTMPEVDFFPFAKGELDSDGAVVLLPGAGRPEKMWPVERFRALAERLGDRALAVWGPGEEERARAIGCRMAPKTSLRELAQLLKTASVVIGGDTGPLHLADALGTKVIGLYGPTNPRRNGPYSQLQRCISTYETTKRMETIAVDDVIAMIGR